MGYVQSGSKRLRYRGGLLDLNGAAASALTRDKFYAYCQLSERALPIPRSQSFFAHSFEPFALKRGTAAALRWAEELGYPVFVKPNEGTRAIGAQRVDNADQCAWALENCFAMRQGRVTLVQEFIEGQELRLLVVDDRVVLGYKKQALTLAPVPGRSVREHIEVVNAERQSAGHKPIKLDDARVARTLLRQGLTLQSVPTEGFQLGDGLSLELGAGVELLKPVPKPLADIAVSALGALGLRYGSVDAIQPVGSDSMVIIEVNSAPGVITLSRLGYLDEAVGLYKEALRAAFQLKN